MKKILVLLCLSMILSGCTPAVFNLNNFVMPDDKEFITIVESLDTPEKITNYMKDNFSYKIHYFYTPDPYILWKTKNGDCNDFATFGTFIARYHNYETYFIILYLSNYSTHAIAVYKESKGYTYSTNQEYFPLNVESIEKVIEHYDIYDWRYYVIKYEVK